MAYVIFFTDSTGTPAHQRTERLDDAVGAVEHLRNDLEVTDAEIHELSSVPVTFKTYYRVEVPTGDAPAGEPTAAAVIPVAQQGQVPSPPLPFADQEEVGTAVPGLMPLDEAARGAQWQDGGTQAAHLAAQAHSAAAYGAIPALEPLEPLESLEPDVSAAGGSVPEARKELEHVEPEAEQSERQAPEHVSSEHVTAEHMTPEHMNSEQMNSERERLLGYFTS